MWIELLLLNHSFWIICCWFRGCFQNQDIFLLIWFSYNICFEFSTAGVNLILYLWPCILTLQQNSQLKISPAKLNFQWWWWCKNGLKGDIQCIWKIMEVIKDWLKKWKLKTTNECCPCYGCPQSSCPDKITSNAFKSVIASWWTYLWFIHSYITTTSLMVFFAQWKNFGHTNSTFSSNLCRGIIHELFLHPIHEPQDLLPLHFISKTMSNIQAKNNTPQNFLFNSLLLLTNKHINRTKTILQWSSMKMLHCAIPLIAKNQY